MLMPRLDNGMSHNPSLNAPFDDYNSGQILCVRQDQVRTWHLETSHARDPQIHGIADGLNDYG